MKKKNVIIIAIIGAIFFTMIGVGAATMFSAKDIEYTPSDESWEVNNLEEAVNNLYEIASNSTDAYIFLLSESINSGNSGTNSISSSKTLEKGNYIFNVHGVSVKNMSEGGYNNATPSVSATSGTANISKINGFTFSVEITSETATIQSAVTYSGRMVNGFLTIYKGV